MEELHEQACQQIFQSRNSSHPDVLDLHGLHVDEALSILETFLLKQARELVDGPPQSQSQSSRAQHKSAVATATGLYNGSFSSATATSSALSASSGSGSSGGGGGGKGTHAGFKLVYVITGTGHHSQSKKARLQPAVQKFLAERGYASVDTSPDGRGGMLTVTIKP
jgi:hypothetical protein